MNFLRRLMTGRNGPDNLTITSVALALILNLIYSFSGYLVFEIISTILLLYAVFRIFSRNVVKRRAENAWFMGFFAPIKSWFSWKITQMKSSKTHKFFRCPGCKNILRVPRGKGRIHITCPKCGQRFEGKT
ncbi:MAG TPA: hypothetical protein GXZ65_01490 [Clostridiales bacterium]|jgi:uncharacterized C2H2 Zn-finger protein|nr:hypothetical protein [Clostridiales bacterium]